MKAHHTNSPTAITDLVPVDTFPMQAVNVPLNEAMFDLCRACAIEYDSLPQGVFDAYTDRDHSKFNLVRWQRYLDGLTDAIAANMKAIRKTCPRVLRAYKVVTQVKAAKVVTL
jgi:hypothetical protein